VTLAIVAVFWSVSIVVILVAVVLGGPVGLLCAAGIGVLAVAAVTGILRHRMRAMGVCVVDGTAGTLSRMAGDEVAREWALSEITFERRRDPLHRGFVAHYWLVARMLERLGLRLAKGPAAEIDALKERFDALRKLP